MNRIESQEKTISDLLKRNLYLESIVFGATPKDDAQIFESKVVHITKSNISDNILGVFLEETEAHALAAMLADSGDVCRVESWAVQSAINDFAPPLTLPFGTRVSYSGKSGKIVGSDYDVSQGLQKVVYTVLPDGLPDEQSSFIHLFHSEISGISDD